MISHPNAVDSTTLLKWLKKAKKTGLKISPVNVEGSSAEVSVHLARMWRVQGIKCAPFICYTVNELIAFIAGYLSGAKRQ